MEHANARCNAAVPLRVVFTYFDLINLLILFSNSFTTLPSFKNVVLIVDLTLFIASLLIYVLKMVFRHLPIYIFKK